MGNTHSPYLDEYLNGEGYPDALAREVRREFEHAVSSNAEKAVERLESGDKSRHDRNEAFILGALPAAVQSEAMLFLYGPFLAASSVFWTFTDSHPQLAAALRALADGGRTTSSDSKAKRKKKRRSSSSADAPPPPVLPRPTSAAVTKAKNSELLLGVTSRVQRREAGKGTVVLGASSEPGMVFVRRGALQMRSGSGGTVHEQQVTAGTGIEVAMVLDDEVVVCDGSTNEKTTYPRDAFTLTATAPDTVYGFVPRSDIESMIKGYKLKKVSTAWAAAVEAAKAERVRAAEAAEAVRLTGLATRLCQAAEAGEAGQLPRLLEEGAPVNGVCGPAAATAVQHAVRGRQLKCLNMLLQHGADVYISDRNGETAMHTACRLGWLEGVRSLLEHACDLVCVPTKSLIRDTPLHLAVKHGDVRILKLIVEVATRSDIALPLHLTNKHGATPITLAASLDALRVLKPRTDLGCAMRVR